MVFFFSLLYPDANRITHRIDIGRRGRSENAEVLLVRAQRHHSQQVRVWQRTFADKRQSHNTPVSIAVLYVHSKQRLR